MTIDATDTKGETPLEHLLKSLKVTAGCRFNAAKRLERHDRKLTRLTAFASAYVIAITVLPYFLKLSSGITDLYNLVTVALSIVILVASLLQYSNGDVVNSEQHHRSALEINELHRLLLLKNCAVTCAELEDFTTRYNAILQKYSINHDDLDFSQYELEHPEMYPWLDWKGRLAIWVRLTFYKNLPSLLLAAITVSVIWLIVRYGVAEHFSKSAH